MRTRSLFRMNRLTPVVLFVALVASLVQVRPAYAASIVVNTSADNYANDGKCTLREAIDAANLNVASGPAAGECAAGSAIGVDTISFHPAFAPYVINVGSGGAPLQQLPHIVSPITITGLGAANTILQAAAAPNTATWRIFQVLTTGTLTLDGVTVRNGRCNLGCTIVGGVLPNSGGAIYNRGILTIANSVFTGNRGEHGGAIYNYTGNLTVTNTTFSNNTAIFGSGGAINNDGGTLNVSNSNFSENSGQSAGALFNNGGSATIGTSTFYLNGVNINGGGISNSTTGIMTVNRSTLTANSAGSGGGIYNAGDLKVSNSTFSGNNGEGGGIYNAAGTTVVWNSTFSGNGGTTGGGVYNALSNPDALSLGNTILAFNTPQNCGGQVFNGATNLDSGSSCRFFTNNRSISNANPLLGPLADNGGPTQTMKLLPGSPAIDFGFDAICNEFPVNGIDQRGVLRPLGAVCDIGAFETSTGRGPDTVGVFRPSNGFLFLKHINLTGFADLALNYGLGGDYPVVGDWDSNGTDTIGVYRGGTFFLRNSNSLGFADLKFDFGQPGDQPVAGDWNADGFDTIGVYRPSTGQFFLRNSNSTGAPDITFFLGNPGDVAIAGDWNGDGWDTTGVFRPSNGFIFLKNSNSTGFADVSLNYGLAGDKPVTGDWNADGIDTIGVLRGNVFLLRNLNTNGFADMSFALGNPGDMPIAGNWDGQP